MITYLLIKRELIFYKYKSYNNEHNNIFTNKLRLEDYLRIHKICYHFRYGHCCYQPFF